MTTPAKFAEAFIDLDDEGRWQLVLDSPDGQKRFASKQLNPLVHAARKWATDRSASLALHIYFSSPQEAET